MWTSEGFRELGRLSSILNLHSASVDHYSVTGSRQHLTVNITARWLRS